VLLCETVYYVRIQNILLTKTKYIIFIHRPTGLINPGYQSDAVRYTPSSQFQKLQGQVDEVYNKIKAKMFIIILIRLQML